MQNWPSNFHSFSFQSSNFQFCQFSPLIFNFCQCRISLNPSYGLSLMSPKPRLFFFFLGIKRKKEKSVKKKKKVPFPLRRAEDKRQEMIVIEPLNAMRTSRLQAINQLQFPHQFQVLHENPSYHGMVILLLDDSQLKQAIQPRCEVGLVAGTVIDLAWVPKAIGEVREDLDRGRLEIGREELEHQRIAGFGEVAMPGLVREVAVVRELLSWRDFVDPFD